MLANPAPATPPTNCRRDIVINSSREDYVVVIAGCRRGRSMPPPNIGWLP
jgi:hypothetical protein